MTELQEIGLRLRNWRLVDFKSVRRAEIEFKPLTLLVGANSSGKSSVLQSILLAVQSVQSGAANGQFSLNGPLVGLGTFDDVCNAKASGHAGFGGTLVLPVALQGEDTFAAQNWPFLGGAPSFGVTGTLQSHGRSFASPKDSATSATIKWDVDIELAGTQTSGSGQIHRADVDVVAGSAEQPARYRLDLTRYSESDISAMFWPTGRSSQPEQDVVLASLPAYSGVARRVKPKPRHQRMGAATFTGVLPIGLAAGQSAVESAVAHWIDYLRGAPQRKSRWRSRRERAKRRFEIDDELIWAPYRLGSIGPAGLAAAPWPPPAVSSPVDTLVAALVSSVEGYREAPPRENVPWPWNLLDTLYILRYAERLPAEQLASLCDDEPTASLLYAIGFVSWVKGEEEQIDAYESSYDSSESRSSEPWKYAFDGPDEEEWFAAGLALRDALDKHEDQIIRAVAAEFPDAGDAYIEPGDDALVLSQASAAAAEFLRDNIYYLGPLREEPHWNYPRSLVPGSSALGSRGEYTAAVLLEHAEKMINAPCPPESGPECDDMTLMAAVKEWLGKRHFGIADDIKVEPSPLGPVLQIRERPDGSYLHLTHVGVGVSQLLPVIVLCLLADEGSVVMLEQPELHLHPKLQQQLGDFLLACARTGRQLIVETHSEYIISRLRYRIAEAPDDSLVPTVGIVFAEKNIKGDTRFRSVVANQYGGIEDPKTDEWPADFFDQTTNEAQEILEAAIRKRRAEFAVLEAEQAEDGE